MGLYLTHYNPSLKKLFWPNALVLNSLFIKKFYLIKNLLPPLHRKRRIDCINTAKRAISRNIIADVCFIENNDLPTFLENKQFSTLTLLTIMAASPIILTLPEIQAYRVNPEELRNILSYYVWLQMIAVSHNNFWKFNAPISVQRRKYLIRLST